MIDQDFGGLIELWLHDTEVAKQKANRKTQSHQQDSAKLTRNAVSLISRGYLSKAVNRMVSHGIASPTDPAAVEALKRKYPPRKEPLPTQVVKGQAVEGLSSLRDLFLSLRPGIAPGT